MRYVWPNESRNRGSFFWRGALILLPALILAGVGFYSLRQDRAIALAEARKEAESLVQDLANRTILDWFWLELPDTQDMTATLAHASDPAHDLAWRIWGQRGALVWRFNATGALSYPPSKNEFPVPIPIGVARVAREQEALDTTRGEALKRFQSSKEMVASGRLDLARQTLEALADGESDVRTESGFALAPLAAIQWLRTLKTNGVERAPLHRALDTLGRHALNEPSGLSRRLLEEAAKLTPAGGQDRLRQWRDVLEVHGRIRSLSAELEEAPAERLESLENPTKRVEWALARGEPSGDLIWNVAWHHAAISNSLSRVIDGEKAPRYLGFALTVDGHPITPMPRDPPLAIMRSSEFGSAPPFEVQAWLAHPDVLYDRQRQRTMIFGSLVGVATLTVVIGWLVAWRAFARQLRLNEMKSNFVSSVSHELRAPIASVRLMAEELADIWPPEREKSRTYHRYISQECQRLSGLIENVLDFSRIERGRKQYDFAPTDLTRLMRETVQTMTPYASEREVSIQCDLNGAEVTIQADGSAIQQALVNLIDNAIKHSPTNGSVSVGLQESAEAAQCAAASSQTSGSPITSPCSLVTLSVCDQGPGIPAEERERIFDAFFRRGSEFRRETQGVGLGLAIVKHVVEAHRGRVWMDSSENGGSRFVMELPSGDDSRSAVSATQAQ